LDVAKKGCPPAEDQLPLESRKVWTDVTAAIHAKEFSKATKMKQSIEARQRKDAAARKETDQEWVPTYFVLEDNGGRPELSAEGREMVESIIRGGNYSG
jgi:oxysterol-binding protein-related protein 9/10/11